MAITLYHHPHSRAATVLWMLEEVGCPYDIKHVDMPAGEQQASAFKSINPMGKLPTLVDGDVVITESAAIALYLGDRYASGRLAPALDAPERGTYLRWSFYAPSVLEPGVMAKTGGWEYKPSAAGWGTWDSMLDTLRAAIGDGPYLLGEHFSMADTVFGGTMKWLVQFGLLPKDPVYTAYIQRLEAREAGKRSLEINRRIEQERGLSS